MIVEISPQPAAQVTVHVQGGAIIELLTPQPAHVEVCTKGPQGARGPQGADIGNYDPGDLVLWFENGLI